jgi:cyclophilin family peptidyl-prolyl cis-trans isomerase
VATEKRERQRANRARKQEQDAKTERQEQRRQVGFTTAIIAVAILAGLGLLFVATRGGEETATDETDTSEQVADPEASDEADVEVPEIPEPAVEVPAPGGTIDGPTECPPADGSTERITTFSEAPPMCIDPSAQYQATFVTNLGDFTVDLDAEAAPNTVNNFVVLARYHYYDGVPFHRIIPGFVIQGGDAVGPVLGQGNPGYLIAEEPPPAPAEGETAYEVGSFAMAKSAGPNATGAQFFVVTGDQGAALPPEYSLFGQVSEGLDIISGIEALPTTADDYPTEEIYIETVIIIES